MYIRRGDTVVVLSGDDKGKKGEVLSVDLKKSKVLVKGLNLAMKHIKRGHPKAPQGGRIEIERPIHSCKLALIDPKSGKPTRTGFRFLPDGTKERYAKLSGLSLGIISHPKEKKKAAAE